MMWRMVEPPVRSLSAIEEFLSKQSNNVNSASELSHSSEIKKSETNISGITSRAQHVEPGDLFVALPGKSVHGAEFYSTAKSRGAAAVLTDQAGATLIKESSTAPEIPTVTIESPRRFIGDLAAWFFDNPIRSMFSAGITGTNGKTTVSTLLYQLWRDATIEAGLIGTLGTYISSESMGSESEAGQRTTPEADELQNTFAVMKERHIKNVAMEVSSHALSQHRVDGVRFSVAGFTNLTQDHLDFHGSMADYFSAKAKLFTVERAEKAFIMVDGEYGKELVNRCEIPFVTLSRFDRKATWHLSDATQTSMGWDISVRGEGGVLIEGSLPLLGEHNIENALLAIAIAVESGLDPIFVGTQLRNLRGAQGRLEKIEVGQPFHALVDYAHTPDAVERVLTSAREFTEGKIIAVLGCGGDRDRSKRPLMGKALLHGADVAICTSDNPRSENPEVILQEMTVGLAFAKPHAVITDRREAISYAVSLAQPGDTVLLLGKGHESGQEINGVVHPFNDRDELATAIVGGR